MPNPTQPETVPPDVLQRPMPMRSTALALAETLFPAGDRLAKPRPEVAVDAVAGYMSYLPITRHVMRGMLIWLEIRFWIAAKQRIVNAPATRREEVLVQLSKSLISGNILRGLCAPFKTAYIFDEENLETIGFKNGLESPPKAENHRWHSQIMDPNDFEAEERLEAEVVVLGSGAGGAVTAYGTASRGLATVIIEEGDYFERADFTGKHPYMTSKLYRDYGLTGALGNTVIPIWAGKCVGGTTLINSGTCIRTPNTVLADWRAGGLGPFTPLEMEPYFARAESMLRVTEAERKYIGPIADVVEKGAGALGFTGTHALTRNADGCDGQALCQFGCPTDAKRSTNVSYVPEALKHGAVLAKRFRADKLIWEGNRVKGVEAIGTNSEGKKIKLIVEAPTVVVSMGSFYSPVFLKQNGVKNPNVGKHLSIHPAAGTSGRFTDLNFPHQATIPQAFSVSDLSHEGIMFEGANLPLPAYALSNGSVGQEWIGAMENYLHTGFFGFLLKDESRGRVWNRGRGRRPLITYNMNRYDFKRFLKATELTARMFFRAGAEEVYIPGCLRTTSLKNEHELSDFLLASWKPRDFGVTAYHTLGTARIAGDPTQGVCDSEHKVFGHEGLYVIDGSSVPTSLGVNPQLTIMTLAERAAERLAEGFNR